VLLTIQAEMEATAGPVAPPQLVYPPPRTWGELRSQHEEQRQRLRDNFRAEHDWYALIRLIMGPLPEGSCPYMTCGHCCGVSDSPCQLCCGIPQAPCAVPGGDRGRADAGLLLLPLCPHGDQGPPLLPLVAPDQATPQEATCRECRLHRGRQGRQHHGGWDAVPWRSPSESHPSSSCAVDSQDQISARVAAVMANYKDSMVRLRSPYEGRGSWD
jgi:hypothetical protein